MGARISSYSRRSSRTPGCDTFTSFLILCHNHPSGSPIPGTADAKQTESLKKGAETFGISLLDHVIIGDNCYYSFADEEISWV